MSIGLQRRVLGVGIGGFGAIGAPVAKALIGKEVGDEVTIIAPAKTIEYEITDITY